MRLFVVLHVLTMILAVGVSGGAETLVHRVVGTRARLTAKAPAVGRALPGSYR